MRWVVVRLLVHIVIRAVAIDPMDAVRLERGRHRALQFKDCVAAIEHSADNFHISGRHVYELTECPMLNVTYAHVFKSAGTTLRTAVEQWCPGQFVRFTSWDNHLEAHSEAEINSHTIFTFVRDPVTRFQSALFELSTPARRGDRNSWISKMVDKAFALNRTVASVAIDDMSLKNSANAHLLTQVAYLVDELKPLPIAFIGGVTPWLVSELKVFVNNMLSIEFDYSSIVHARDAGDPDYAAGVLLGPFGSLHDEILDSATIRKIQQYYHLDYECFGLV